MQAVVSISSIKITLLCDAGGGDGGGIVSLHTNCTVDVVVDESFGGVVVDDVVVVVIVFFCRCCCNFGDVVLQCVVFVWCWFGTIVGNEGKNRKSLGATYNVGYFVMLFLFFANCCCCSRTVTFVTKCESKSSSLNNSRKVWGSVLITVMTGLQIAIRFRLRMGKKTTS